MSTKIVDTLNGRTNGQIAKLSAVRQHQLLVRLDFSAAPWKALGLSPLWIDLRYDVSQAELDTLLEDKPMLADLLPSLIAAWNLADDSGMPLQVTPDTLRQLGAHVLRIVYRHYFDTLNDPLALMNATRSLDTIAET